MISWRPFVPLVFLLLGLNGPILPTAVQAQGFGVYEQGACVMGRAGTAVAQGCGDGSSMYFNPAHLAGVEGFVGTLGTTVISANGSFTYDYIARPPYTGAEIPLQNNPIPIPHFYATYGRSGPLSFGLGAYVPYGLESRWPFEMARDVFFDGAFEGFDNRVQAIYVQPSVAYQISPRLSVGGGPIVAISAVELNQVLDLAAATVSRNGQEIPLGQLGVPHHTAFATSSLEDTGAIGFGANVGVSFQLTDQLRVGARFTTPITISYEGEATFDPANRDDLSELVFAPPSPLAADTDGDGTPDTPITAEQLTAPRFEGDGVLTDQAVETELTFPAQAVAGLSVQATDRLLLLADYQFTGWSSFDTIPLDFAKLGERTRIENFNDTHGIRLGGEYDLYPRITVRGGYIYNTAAAPDATVTPLLPESDRHHATAGVRIRLSSITELNFAYQRLLQTDRRGRVRGPLPGEAPTPALNNGVYEFGGHLFSGTLTLNL